MEPGFLPGSLQASHTADYLLHFHLSAVVLCLSFLVSDFLSLFLHIPLDWGPFKDKKSQVSLLPQSYISQHPVWAILHFVGSLCRLVSRICDERGTAGKPWVFTDSGPLQGGEGQNRAGLPKDQTSIFAPRK